MTEPSRQGDNPAHVQQILRLAEAELKTLQSQRILIARRIATIKQVVAGLLDLFGEQAVSEPLLNSLSPKQRGYGGGITKACRWVLMRSDKPMSTQEVCRAVEAERPSSIATHANPLASVNTVLKRLADGGEARVLPSENGKRRWQWAVKGETWESLNVPLE